MKGRRWGRGLALHREEWEWGGGSLGRVLPALQPSLPSVKPSPTSPLPAHSLLGTSAYNQRCWVRSASALVLGTQKKERGSGGGVDPGSKVGSGDVEGSGGM